MSIWHLIDFAALVAIVFLLCDELRLLDGRRRPWVATLIGGFAVLAFYCAAYDLSGKPLPWPVALGDVLLAGVTLLQWRVWRQLK